MPNLRRLFLISTILVSLCACQTAGSDDNRDYGRLGAQGAGAVVGGLLGSQIGGGAGQLAATAAGAVVGGWLAGELYDELSKRDRAITTANTSKTLSNSPDNATERWENPDSGTTTTITPKNRYQQQKRVQIARDAQVASPENLTVIGTEYTAVTNANLRRAPTTSSERIGGLTEGERFNAVGSVADNSWVLISRDGITKGYVYAKLVQPYDGPDDSVAGVRKPIDLDEAETGSDIRVDNVEATTTCREGTITVAGDGASKTQNFTACKAPDGAWEL